MLQQESEPLHIYGVVLEAGAKLIFADTLTSPKSWLSVPEPLKISPLSPHRLHNQMAGHMAARTLLQKIYAVPLHAIHIDHYPSGAPYAEAAGQRYDISISHTAAHGVAALSLEPEFSVGIDLVKRRVMDLDGLIEKTLDSAEQVLMKDHQTDFFALWALKEAALKTWQVGMRVPIWDVHVRTMGSLFQIKTNGFSPLYGTTLELGAPFVVGVTWGEADSRVKWLPRGTHLGC